MLHRMAGRPTGFLTRKNSLIAFAVALLFSVQALADDALERRASWHRYDAAEMTQKLRASLDTLGVAPDEIDRLSDEFLSAIEKRYLRSDLP